MESDQFIKLNNLVKTYTSSEQSFNALSNINLTIKNGEFIIICGKSGSGKSTMLNMISGIDSPTSGEIWVDGAPLHTLTSDQLAQWRGKRVGIVFQFFQLMPTLNALENILLPMEFVDTIPRHQQRSKAKELLERVGVSKLAKKFPHTLSGGEKQRVAIARALANNPDLIVADEPTGNIDTENTAIIHSLFNKLVDEGKTVVYVTHEQQLKLAYTRLLNVEDGEITQIQNSNN